jgi:hypothetical protein
LARTGKSGANITASFNVGNIYADEWAGGLIAYAPFGDAVTIENNYVMGDIKSAITAVTVTSGATVALETPYAIETATKGTLYFMVPAAGTITLEADDTITYKATTAQSFTKEDIQTDDTVEGYKNDTKNGNYTFTTADGNKWAIYAYKKGTITITEVDGGKPIVTVDGVEIYVTPWNTTDNKTFTNWPTLTSPITRAAALVWDRLAAHDYTNNYVLEGTAGGLNAHLGYGIGWYAMEYCSEAKTFTMEDLTSGKLAYMLNENLGETVFYQNLDPELFAVDEYPTTDKTHAKVVLIGTEYQNQVFVQDASGSPETGDAIVYVTIALVVSTLSLAAMAVAKKAKEN